MNKIFIPGNTLLCLITLQLTLLCWPASAFAQGGGARLLLTITNPTPASGDVFGESVTAVGNDRVLIGSEVAAEAYLFSLNGTLLTTFTNPEAPGGGGFGYSLAALGSDRVVIGNYNYFAGVTQVGRAYLFGYSRNLVAERGKAFKVKTLERPWFQSSVLG